MNGKEINGYRVVVCVTQGTVAPHIMADFSSALEKLGHSVFTADLRALSLETEAREREVFDLINAVGAFKPDFALSYGISGLFPHAIQNIFEALKVPYASLFFDNPMAKAYGEEFEALFRSPLYTMFVWDRYYIRQMKDLGYEAFYLPLAANTDLFKPMPSDPEHAADVAFVGAVAGVSDYAKQRREEGWPDWMTLIAQSVVEMKLAERALPAEEILDRLLGALPVEQAQAAERHLSGRNFIPFWHSIYDQYGDAARDEAVGRLPEARIKLYGTGWEGMRREGVEFKGAADYRTQTPSIYNSAKINLNVTGAQLVCSVNQRVFDVAASGAFLLTDEREDMASLFEIGAEAAVYSDARDMRSKIEYYLARDGERREIARRARERVLADHTYMKRVEKIIETLKEKRLL